MRSFITTSTLAACLLSTAALAEQPTACQPTEAQWWAKQIHAALTTGNGVDLSRSAPEIGVAYVTWSDGVQQVVVVRQVHQGKWCATHRRTVRTGG